jgi:hypothetical protein
LEGKGKGIMPTVVVSLFFLAWLTEVYGCSSACLRKQVYARGERNVKGPV